MGTTLRFSKLPQVPNVERITRSLIQDRQKAWTSQQELIAKRQEAAEAIQPTDGDAVRVNDLSLLKLEAEARTLFEVFIRKALETSREILAQSPLEIETAKEAAKVRLIGAGYFSPVEGKDVVGAYSLKMARQHPFVQAAFQRRRDAEKFVKKYEPIRRENLRWVQALTSKLGRLTAVPA
jgi:hypothetical protein